ncbi:hypothetical protein FRX31_009908 [Thalictrum thalictroides]|uniref:Uncharacterized protein n=1 Tax=Thalictrum thalictroides TaxID=46969 RepID=A0A7J6WU01_THATH|nr:hypothetical protein FRX31_009908 [Thalictrum thalictroides]
MDRGKEIVTVVVNPRLAISKRIERSDINDVRIYLSDRDVQQHILPILNHGYPLSNQPIDIHIEDMDTGDVNQTN